MASGQVAMFDPKQGKVQATISVGNGADGLAWAAAR
jgi:hypothetical protein